MKNTSIGIAPIAGALGAEVHGIDLAESMDDATFEQVQRALLEHCVLFFASKALHPNNTRALPRASAR